MLHTFLMAGQSNMSGRGLLEEAELICDKRIKMLRNGVWMPMTEPIQCDFPWAGIGPAASFAAAWVKDHPEQEIGLIPCSHGGSTAEQWLPGAPLFEHAVLQVRLALRGGGRLEGVLWHQGESDCTGAQMQLYCQKLQQIVNGFRRALDMPDAPFLIGALGDYLKQSTYLECSSQYTVLNDLLKWFVLIEHDCYFVTAEGLGCNPDHLHFNAASQRVFGLRYYEAYRTRSSVYAPLPSEPPVQSGSDGWTRDERLHYIRKHLFEAEL